MNSFHIHTGAQQETKAQSSFTSIVELHIVISNSALDLSPELLMWSLTHGTQNCGKASTSGLLLLLQAFKLSGIM